MNPLLGAALGSIIRWALAMAVPFFVSNGIWTPDESTAYVTGATAALLSLGWSLWQKYGARSRFLQALWSSPSTPERFLAELPAPPMSVVIGPPA